MTAFAAARRRDRKVFASDGNAAGARRGVSIGPLWALSGRSLQVHQKMGFQCLLCGQTRNSYSVVGRGLKPPYFRRHQTTLFAVQRRKLPFTRPTRNLATERRHCGQSGHSASAEGHPPAGMAACSCFHFKLPQIRLSYTECPNALA